MKARRNIVVYASEALREADGCESTDLGQKRRKVFTSLVLAAAMLVAGCAENPITGRSQFLVVSEEQAISSSATAYREMIGDLARRKKIESGTARAGYDPRAAVTLWEEMSREGGSPPEFLSTDPSPDNRRERLQALAGDLEPIYRDAKSLRRRKRGA